MYSWTTIWNGLQRSAEENGHPIVPPDVYRQLLAAGLITGGQVDEARLKALAEGEVLVTAPVG
jgi:hypothetical protein